MRPSDGCTVRTEEMVTSTGIAELMNKYTNQQLTSAQVMAELVALAAEVTEESNRGAHFTPPLSSNC